MSAENLRFVVSLSLRFALWMVLILYANQSNRRMRLWGLIGIAVNGLWAMGFLWLPNGDRRRKEANRAAPAVASLLVAVVVLVALGTAVAQQGAVAQQQPQKPKLHGFKAHLCAMSTGGPLSPTWDNCMARGFGHPQPSEPNQPAAAPQLQVAPPQAKPQEPIAKEPPVQAQPQEPIVKDPPVQAKPQEPIAKEPAVQAKPQEPIVKEPAVQAKPQEPIAKDPPVQNKTCIEYMTTVSGAQTCLRWKGEQDQ